MAPRRTSKKRKRRKKRNRLSVLTVIVAVLCAMCAAGGFYYYTAQNYLHLKGDSHVSIGLNGAFDDPGVEAGLHGEDVSDQVRVTSDFDPSVPGDYVIRYEIGHFSVSRKISVGDKMDVEMDLKGPEKMTILLGQPFIDPGCRAWDSDGNDISSEIRVSDTDFKKAGTHHVTYTVYNEKGRGTRLIRRVRVLPNTEYEAPGFPICMYHYVYDENDPPDDLNRRYGNYISVQALTEEVNWLKSEGYYFPTWQEVRDYADGRLILPDKSIVLTFDDGERASLELGVPLMEKLQVPWTSFLITSKKGEEKVREFQGKYLNFQSHTHDMHRAGGVRGHKGIFPVTNRMDGMNDLLTSIRILGGAEAFAYPYGDYSDNAKLMVEQAGFLCAVTTQPGWVHPGTDPYLLPRQRMSLGQSLESFIVRVAD